MTSPPFGKEKIEGKIPLTPFEKGGTGRAPGDLPGEKCFAHIPQTNWPRPRVGSQTALSD